MSAEAEHHEVVIVGGGVSGLFTAKKLIAAGIEDVIVLESRGGVGGRISTTRDSDGNPMFNNFAWRVSETNTMMIELAKELGLKLVPQTTPPAKEGKHEHGKCKHGPYSCDREEEKKREVPENRAPLSDFATAGLNASAGEADFQDRNSGYAGRTSQVRKSHISFYYLSRNLPRIVTLLFSTAHSVMLMTDFFPRGKPR